MYGAPGEIRTPDRPVRSRVLYPAELRAHKRTRIICIVGSEIKSFSSAISFRSDQRVYLV